MNKAVIKIREKREAGLRTAEANQSNVRLEFRGKWMMREVKSRETNRVAKAS